MITRAKRLKTLMILALSASALGLAGCGGGDDKGSSDTSSRNGGSSLGGFLLCAALILTSGDDACASAAVSGSSSSGSGRPGSSGSGSSGSGSSGGSGGTLPPSGNHSYLATGDEMEPNNQLINANVPQFAHRIDRDDQTGWIVDGSASDLDDTRDAFALTPRRAYRYRISLCPPGERACENVIGMDPLTLFWRLLDQDGNEITSSQGAHANKTHVMLDAGLMYYVVVDAGDTMGASVEYKLYVYEQSQ